MRSILDYLRHTVWLGMPLGVWMIVFGLGAFNEVVNRAKWTEAQSILQGLASFFLWIPVLGPVLTKFPVLGALISRIAAKDPDAGKMPLPPSDPPSPPVASLLPLLFLASLALTACGLKTTYALLSAAEQVDKAAAAQLPDFDRQTRAGIVLTAKSTEDGTARLHDWDGKVEKLVKAVEGVHASVILARDGANDVSKGIRAKAELSGWIDPVLRAAVNLKNLLASVGLRLAVQ